MKIILVSRNFSPFILNEINVLSNIYKQLILIAPEDIRYRTTALTEMQHLKMELYSLFHKFFFTALGLLKTPKKFLLEEILKFRPSEIFRIAFFKSFLESIFLAELLKSKVKKYVSKGDFFILYSLWFNSSAYAIANLDSKKLNFKSYKVSLTHLYEVSDVQEYPELSIFRDYYIENIDYISFISSTIMQGFISSKNQFLDTNIHHDKLGTLKLFSSKIKDMYKSSNEVDQPLKIISCSNFIKIKNIDRIFTILNKIDTINIVWTHIGDGDLYNSISQEIELYKKSHLKILLLGRMSNYKVQELYANEDFDIFINLSSIEGIPLSIMEAISYGITVIATDVGGTKEVLDEKFSYLVYENSSDDEIIDVIMKHYYKTRLDKMTMSANAIEYFDNNLNADLIRTNFHNKILKNAKRNN